MKILGIVSLLLIGVIVIALVRCNSNGFKNYKMPK
jgi:hypothetical protein